MAKQMAPPVWKEMAGRKDRYQLLDRQLLAGEDAGMVREQATKKVILDHSKMEGQRLC